MSVKNKINVYIFLICMNCLFHHQDVIEEYVKMCGVLVGGKTHLQIYKVGTLSI